MAREKYWAEMAREKYWAEMGNRVKNCFGFGADLA